MPPDAISNLKADCNALFQSPYPTLLHIFNQRILVTLPHTSSIGGLFLGGETGFLIGSASAERTIIKDPETRARIEKAFQKFKADVLKKELQQLEDGGSSFRLF